MGTFTKVELTGKADGRGVKVAATSSPGTTVHAAGASDTDEVWLYAHNSDTADHTVHIEFGGTTDPDDLIEYTIVSQSTSTGLVLVVPGLLLKNSNTIKAWADAADKIVLFGYVNRISA